MSSGFKKSLIALSVSGMLASSAAYATNGYFAHGYSTKEKGLAGAGVAYSQDSLAAATNPAGMVHVGERMDIGAAIFNPNRSYTTTGGPSQACDPGTGACSFSIGPQSIDSNSEYFLIPHFGYNWMLDESSAAGISVYGNGGMNTNYKGGTATLSPDGGATWMTLPGTYGAGSAGVNLSQLFIAGTYSKKLNDEHSVGASLIFAYQKFKADGLANFSPYSTNPSALSNNSSDTSSGFGAKLGWQGKVVPSVTLGASYQTKMSMSEFDDYAGLFAEQGDFDIPATLIVGAAWDIDDKSKLLVDIQTIYYSGVDSISNGISNLTSQCIPAGTPGLNPTPVQSGGAGSGAGCLGGANGAGFGWDDMTVIKLGYQWMQDDMTWRVGVSHGNQPIPNTEVLFNILAPGVMETHLTFGFTKPLSADSEFNFSAMYAPSNDVTGTSTFDQAQTIKLEMDQMELQASYAMKF